MTRTWLPALAAVAALVLIVAWMAGTFDQRMAPGLDARDDKQLDVLYTVALEDVLVMEPVSGSIEAKQATLVSSRIMARIQRILVRSGDRVDEGDLLLELEKSDLEARLQQAAEQKQAVAARLQEAERNLRRAEQLHRQELLSTADLDAAQANRDTLQAELQRAEQTYREAQAARAYASIRSPIDGVVVDRFAEPGDTAVPGARLISLYNPLSLRAEAQVREQLALKLAVGDALPVALPSLELNVQGTIEEIVPAAEPGSRSFQVKIRLPYDDGLLPGMYVRVRIPAGTEQRMYVPADLVAQVGQLYVVMVAGPEGPERRFLRLGQETQDGRVEVKAGLSPGDQLLGIPAGCPAMTEC
ncbi:efflux RND transporter periplasmic adaptor subunit [Kineobactrum sediminis]|uniref:Efflux RND transporter periplasmic adaptor subunit n=1 Tax=Kineobactrum sediminis TaxID=1905677 RepID=A0A2N5Y0M3_9GAMM|nr:efflux RND transporter periplasmic adaptor subunit [Kineobactrum sediminis]PLW81945.1 efflux RND transporter periplasmic adaptor subunit [Kineobactrum sediminis]